MSNGSGLFSKQVSKKPHLLAAGGLAAEIADIRSDVGVEMKPMAALSVDEFTAPVAAVTNAIKLAVATVATTAELYSGAALDGSVGAGTMPVPRNISITTGGVTPANAPSGATITGTFRGKVQTETIAPATTATTVFGLKPFDAVTSIALTADAAGTAATLAFGFGPALGVGKTPKTRAGGVVIVRENVDGSLVTTGALTATGLYTPATAPNAAHNYCLYYEYDPTVA